MYESLVLFREQIKRSHRNGHIGRTEQKYLLAWHKRTMRDFHLTVKECIAVCVKPQPTKRKPTL
jgi:hypothetical protein